MSVALTTLNKINIQEIELLKAVLGIKFDTKHQEFVLTKSFSSHQLLELYAELKYKIWNPSNVATAVKELEVEKSPNTRIHYFGSGRAEGLDSYISKMGIMNNEVIVEDPLCFLITVNPDYKDHPTKSPTLYVKYVYEHAVSMIHLEEWVKKGFIYFAPSLPLFDIGAFWNLAETNQEIASKIDFNNLPSIKKAFRYSKAEGTLNLMLEFARLRKNNYKMENIKQIFPGIDDEKAKKYLDIVKNQTLEEREGFTVKWVLEKHKLPYKEKLSLLSHYEKSRPFNIERFLDVSKLNGAIMPAHGMPLLQTSYISERFNCIPSTDNPGLMHNYEGWCDVLKRNMDPQFEKVRTDISLPFGFLDNLPLHFVEQSREKGLTTKISSYLDEEWAKIRETTSNDEYIRAAYKYSSKIEDEFHQLEKENQLVNDELLVDITQTGYTGLGAFVGFNLVTELPLAIVGTISAMLIKATDAGKTYRKGKNNLESKPLALFLKAKKMKRKE